MKYFLTGILPDMLNESGYASKYSKNVLYEKKPKKSLFVVFERDGVDVRGSAALPAVPCG